MNIIEKIEMYLDEDNWSSGIKTHWHPPEGTFTKSAEEIVDVLMKARGGLKKARKRLAFYINRAGVNLSSERKAELRKADILLQKENNK